jgi:hypothetical protein
VRPEAGPPFSGLGILVWGGHDAEVQHNHVLDNRPAAAAPLSEGIVVASSAEMGGADPADVDVRRNEPQGNQPDLRWDGTGTDNDIARNDCDTSEPPGLCG